MRAWEKSAAGLLARERTSSPLTPKRFSARRCTRSTGLFPLEGSLAALAEQPEPLQALADWLGQAERLLRDSGFERGCPLATVALESTADDDMLRDALAQGFARLRLAVSGLLERLGIAPPRAQALATLVLSAYEGALLQARVAGDGATMTITTGLLLDLLQHERNNKNPESP